MSGIHNPQSVARYQATACWEPGHVINKWVHKGLFVQAVAVCMNPLTHAFPVATTAAAGLQSWKGWGLLAYVTRIKSLFSAEIHIKASRKMVA